MLKEDKNWIAKYLLYCQQQNINWFLWYVLTLVSLATVVMPVGVFLMRNADFVVGYITISMFLFLLNMCCHVAQMNAKVSITIFIATLFFHVFSLVGYLVGIF